MAIFGAPRPQIVDYCLNRAGVGIGWRFVLILEDYFSLHFTIKKVSHTDFLSLYLKFHVIFFPQESGSSGDLSGEVSCYLFPSRVREQWRSAVAINEQT